MRALLDTHSFLWWITGSSRLSAKAAQVIGDGRNEIYLSAASSWEIAIKARLGRIELPDLPDRFISEQMLANAFQGLPIQISHTMQVYSLPDHHSDPFDRMLVAQSLVEKLSIISSDKELSRYAADVIW